MHTYEAHTRSSGIGTLAGSVHPDVNYHEKELSHYDTQDAAPLYSSIRVPVKDGRIEGSLLWVLERE